MKSSLSTENITATSSGIYRTAKEAKLDYEINGEYHNFNGNGYTYDIYPTKTNQSAFQLRMGEELAAGFVSEKTVGFILSFIIYSKDLDLWSYNYALLEKNLQGVIYTHFPNSLVFKPNKFESILEFIFLIIDILRVIIMLGIIFYVIGIEFYRWKFKKIRTLSEFIRVTIVQMIGIALIITYSIFHFHFGPSGKKLLEIAAEEDFNTYQDLWTTARYYKLALQFEALIIIVIALVLLRFLRIIPTFNFFFQVLKDSMRIFAPKAILLFILLLCYSIIASQLWNSVFYGFKDIGNAMVYILLIFELSTGEQKIDLYGQFVFTHEKIFGLILIILIVTTVLYLTITTAIVVKSFDRHLTYLHHTRESIKPPHYMIKWFKAAKLDKLFCVHKCKKKNRMDQYEINSRDEANLEMIRNTNVKS